MKTIPFTAAHTYKAHIWHYPLPPPLRDSKGAEHNWYLQLRHLDEFQILSYDSSHFLKCLVLMCIESLLHFFKQGNKGRGRGAPLGRGKEQVTSSKGRGKYSGGRECNLFIRLLIVSFTNLPELSKNKVCHLKNREAKGSFCNV